MGKRRNKLGPCEYCGAVGERTRDHVIPKALFKGALPSNPRPPLVHVCAACNNEVKSKNDALLKDVLGADYQVFESGLGDTAFESLRRALRNNESELAHAIREAKPTWVKVNGLYAPAFAMRIPLGRVERTLATVIRGLSAYYEQRRLPLDAEYVVRRWYDTHQLDDLLLALTVANAPYHAIGDGTIFDRRYFVAPDDLVSSMWVLRFYGVAYFSVSTYAAGTAPEGSNPFRFEATTTPPGS